MGVVAILVIYPDAAIEHLHPPPPPPKEAPHKNLALTDRVVSEKMLNIVDDDGQTDAGSLVYYKRNYELSAVR